MKIFNRLSEENMFPHTILGGMGCIIKNMKEKQSMKELLLSILNEYLRIFPNETERQQELVNFLNNHKAEQIIDWNNFDGHVVAGGFIYAKDEQKFLVLHHKDLDIFLYSGGHIDNEDNNPLEASKREINEETGLNNIIELTISDNELVPIDIDTHVINYNKRLGLPQHYHFEYRYLYVIDKIENIKVDSNESSEYKWISEEELRQDKNYGRIVDKFDLLDLKNIFTNETKK